MSLEFYRILKLAMNRYLMDKNLSSFDLMKQTEYTYGVSSVPKANTIYSYP